MSLSSPISFADLVRGFNVVARDSEPAFAGVAAALGFVLGESKVENPARPEPNIESPKTTGTAELHVPKPSPISHTPDDGSDIGELLPFQIETTLAPQREIIPESEVPLVSRRAERMEIHPLFDPLQERAILTEAAGVACHSGQLAVAEAINILARAEPLNDLTLESILSLSKGCQILVDTGLGMEPFARDCRQILLSIRRVLGTESTNILYFVDCPTKGVLDENYQDLHYEAPPNGRPVLALTDLCSGGPRAALREAEPKDWLPLIYRIMGVGNPVIVLNPYPPARWPKALIGRVPIVYWDRATAASTVRRIRRLARN